MRFTEPNAPTNIGAIKSFEKERGVRLPSDYVDFLMETNGGYYDPQKFYAKVQGWNSLLVQELFGITDDPSRSITNHTFTNFSDYMHQFMLKIGYDPFSEALFMDLREGANHGKIYIRAHNSPPNDQILIDDTGFQDEDDYEEAQIFFPVADSFSEFAAMLGPIPDES